VTVVVTVSDEGETKQGYAHQPHWTDEREKKLLI